MPEYKFACPHCGQTIQCDERWSGQQVACPSCQGAILIPEIAAAAPAATPVAPQPSMRPPSARAKQSAGFPVKKIAAIAAGVAAFAVFYYFGLGWADKLQSHVNATADKAAKSADGGEVGHIARLYQVLDATEPEHMGRIGGIGSVGGMDRITRPLHNHGMRKGEMDVESFEPPPNPAEKLSVLPAEWTLDVQAAKIPEGRANGAIAGTNFVIKTASLQPSAGSVILSLRQGDDAADPAFFIYLPVKPGESALGQTWTVAKDSKGKGTPQIVKRWQPNARFAPVQKTVASGYAMQLELGAVSNFWIPGKIFLSLPDKEKTFLAGQFYIASEGSQ